MNPSQLDQVIEMHKSGMSMSAIGLSLGKSAAWVCKGFKAAGYSVDRRATHPTAFSDTDIEFLLTNHDKPRKWLAKQIGRSAQAVSQWLQKRSLQIMPAPLDRRLPAMECKQCHKHFNPLESGRKFCSSECYQEGYQTQHISVRRYEYNGINMRSTWEIKFAKWLDSMGFTWKYEPTWFALPNRKRYAPDFYVEDHGTYYEVKGWMKEAAAEKIRQFREIYAEHRLVLINKDVFKTYGIKV